jgi:hypothetical protein
LVAAAVTEGEITGIEEVSITGARDMPFSKPYSTRPTPSGKYPAPVVELAKSIARAKAEQLEQDRAELQQWTQRLLDRGMSPEDAAFYAGRDWLHAQRTRT